MSAFKALSNEAIQTMYKKYSNKSSRFVNVQRSSVSDKNAFEKQYSVELRDFNSAGVVAANKGIPLSKMDKNVYHVYGEKIQVSNEQRDLCKETIENLVSRLSALTHEIKPA